MNHHIQVYRNVFLALLVLTGFTVGASYFEFGGIVWLAIGVGLAIAFVKGYLVAANFMHLNNEKPFIYMTLIITLICFVILFFMPTMWHNDGLHSPDHIPIQNGEVYKEINDSDSHHNHKGHH
tara:strand:+ start:713 stop:1081 length:369 start_codon:yes stop_codon:yes gene_type:complete